MKEGSLVRGNLAPLGGSVHPSAGIYMGVMNALILLAGDHRGGVANKQRSLQGKVIRSGGVSIRQETISTDTAQ